MTKVKNIVMLGFGDMGKGIAQVCLMAGYSVVAVDINDELIQKGLDYNKTGFEKLESKGIKASSLNINDYLWTIGGKVKTPFHLTRTTSY